MITIITRWESVQMPEQVEWQMWRQLKGAFGVRRLIFIPRVHKMDGYTFDQADSEEEAIAMLAEGTQVCYLEPGGFLSMYDLPNPQEQDVALVLGNTSHSNLHLSVAPPGAYGIRTAGNTDLYGINAAAIALAYMAGQ